MTHVPPTVKRFAVLTAGMTLALILAGGFVTTTRTGDTISGWPFLWGNIEPGFSIEWTHRVLAMVVGLLVLGLAIVTRRPLAWLALGAVCIQAAIGGLRIYVPVPAVSIVHAIFAQVIFGAMAVLAFRASQKKIDAVGARSMGMAATGAAFLQLVAGAITRHTGAGLAVHLLGAVTVVILVSLFASQLLPTGLRRGAWLLLGLLGVQLTLGFIAWIITSGGFVRSHESPVLQIILITSHVAGGALVLATSLVLTLNCGRTESSQMETATA